MLGTIAPLAERTCAAALSWRLTGLCQCRCSDRNINRSTASAFQRYRCVGSATSHDLRAATAQCVAFVPASSSYESADSSVADFVDAVHDEGTRFREDLQRAVAEGGPRTREAVDHAAQRFGDRLENLLQTAVEALRPKTPASRLGFAYSSSVESGSSSLLAKRLVNNLTADEIEAAVRAGFKALGCTTVAVLERCLLGDRGVSAELPGGIWVQAWISSGGSVLWVLPNLPQLCELVKDPAVRGHVFTSLLQYGAGRKESFFITQRPLAVGYKFGPLHPEVLESPAALGSQLESSVAIAERQAVIVELEALSSVPPSSLPVGEGASAVNDAELSKATTKTCSQSTTLDDESIAWELPGC